MTRSRERGSISVFVVSMTTALLLMAGLVLDGGRIVAGRREADAVAAAAARAGAQAIDETGLRDGSSAPILPGPASANVRAYLTSTGFTGTAFVSGDTITVKVQRTQQLSILSLVGLHSEQIHGSGTARAVRAVRGDS
jgi:putative intracellular protease/amidase